METTSSSRWLNISAVLAAIGASLCCVLPVVVVFAGFGSAALGAVFEPYRPYMIAITFALIGFGFYRAYRPQATECEPGQSCAVPENRRRQRILLWIVASLALVLITFPTWIAWVL